MNAMQKLLIGLISVFVAQPMAAGAPYSPSFPCMVGKDWLSSLASPQWRDCPVASGSK
jgi:hypothetical protein